MGPGGPVGAGWDVRSAQMPRWFSDDILRSGPDHLRVLAAAGKTITLHVIKAYAAGDNYSTIVANSVMSVAIEEEDMTWGPGAPSGLAMTISAKAGVSITADSGASPDLHLALVNTTDDAPHIVTDETTDQVLVSGGTKDLPAWAIQCPQP